MLRGFILGIVLTLVVAAGVAYAAVSFGLVPANADATPSGIERWAARTSLNATVSREAPAGDAPIPASEQNLLAGAKIYEANCSACHGVASGHPSTIGLGLYQHAPQFGKHGVTDDPVGETYWKAYHGIRLTGMPAFVNLLSDKELWQVSLFLKNQDTLPPAVSKYWKAMKLPVAAAPQSNTSMPR